MYLTLPATTLFYRVLSPGRPWTDILAGQGAYFGRPYGGRYNRSRQNTVYTSTDPLVALAEYAFYEGSRWQEIIGTTALRNQPHLLPFVTGSGTRPRLWCFRLAPPPTIIDVTDPAALHAFQHLPHTLLNPSSTYYAPTQDLMDAVFHHLPSPQGLKAQGVQAPSVRTPRVGNYQPTQQVFVLAHNQRRLPGTAGESWDLDIEFLDALTGATATPGSTRIDWARPRIRLHPRSGAGIVPAFALRPGSVPYPPSVWHSIEINYV